MEQSKRSKYTHCTTTVIFGFCCRKASSADKQSGGSQYVNVLISLQEERATEARAQARFASGDVSRMIKPPPSPSPDLKFPLCLVNRNMDRHSTILNIKEWNWSSENCAVELNFNEISNSFFSAPSRLLSFFHKLASQNPQLQYKSKRQFIVSFFIS